MEFAVRNIRGEVVDTIEINDTLVGVPMNESLVHQALVMYQANLRTGTRDTKTRSQVAGGGRKPWIQKATGRARQGSIRSPQWRHGGVVFGPHPRDYRQHMPQQMRHLALRCMLSAKARHGNLLIIDSVSMPSPTTKGMKELLSNLGIGSSALIVTASTSQNVARSIRNLPKIASCQAPLLNAGLLLRYEKLVIARDAVFQGEELWMHKKLRTRSAVPGNENESI